MLKSAFFATYLAKIYIICLSLQKKCKCHPFYLVLFITVSLQLSLDLTKQHCFHTKKRSQTDVFAQFSNTKTDAKTTFSAHNTD